MNVLYLSYDGLTDPLGQSQILPYLIPLSQKGAHFTIISFEKKSLFLKNKHIINSLIEEHNIEWIPIQYHKNPPVLSTVFDIIQLRRKIDAIQKNIDFIHARSYISALGALYASKKYRKPFIFDMRGFWIDERIEGNIWNPKNFIFKNVIRYFRKKEKEFLNHSHSIISLTHKGKEILSKKWNVNKSKIQVIPCATDQNHFKPKNDIKKNIDPTLLYVGSTGTWYLIDEMLLFYKSMKEQLPNLKFQIYTGTSPDEIIKKAQNLDIATEGIKISFSNRKDLPAKIQVCHYGICFIKPSFSKSASSPVKMGEYIAMNIPVICNFGVGDNDYIMDKYNVGLSLKNLENIDKNQLKDLNSIPESNFRHAVEDYFSIDKAVNQYWEIYTKITKP